MIELQPSASLGTLRVVVFGRGDRECREWVKPPREPHAIQTVRSCNRYATCLTSSSSLSGSSLPISRFSYPLLLCSSPDSPDLHGHTPRTLTPRFSRSPRLIPSRLIIVSQGDGGEDCDSLRNGMYEPRKSSLKIGSMRDEVRLPEEFDREFDRLDAQVASLFNGMPS